MNKMLLLAAAVVVGVTIGSFVTWFVLRPTHFYELQQETVLTNHDGHVVGRVPGGTLVFGNSRLDPRDDLGWWGYVPVYFGTTDEAVSLLRKTNKPGVRTITDITLNAHKPEDVIATPK